MIKGNNFDAYFKKHESSPVDDLQSSINFFEEEKMEYVLTGNECKRTQHIFSTEETHADEYIRLVAKEEALEFYTVFLAYMIVKVKPSFILNAVINPIYMEEIINNLDNVIDDGYHVLCRITRDFVINKNNILRFIDEETVNKLEELYVTWFIDKNMTYITSIATKLNIPRNIAVEMAIQCPQISKSSPMDNSIVRYYSQNFLNLIYTLTKESTEIEVGQLLDAPLYLKTVINTFFSMKLDQFMLAVFLENIAKTATMTDTQKSVWATVTLVCLDMLESYSYSDIRKFIQYYVSLKYGLKNNTRVSLINGVAQDDYMKIIKACDEFIAEYPQHKGLL